MRLLVTEELKRYPTKLPKAEMSEETHRSIPLPVGSSTFTQASKTDSDEGYGYSASMSFDAGGTSDDEASHTHTTTKRPNMVDSDPKDGRDTQSILAKDFREDWNPKNTPRAYFTDSQATTPASATRRRRKRRNFVVITPENPHGYPDRVLARLKTMTPRERELAERNILRVREYRRRKLEDAVDDTNDN